MKLESLNHNEHVGKKRIEISCAEVPLRTARCHRARLMRNVLVANASLPPRAAGAMLLPRNMYLRAASKTWTKTMLDVLQIRSRIRKETSR